MNMYNFKTFILITCMMFVIGKKADAIPATPYPIDFKLPGGEVLTIQLQGDEYFSWATTIDGYTILLDEKGFYEYAVKNAEGNLVLSGILVHNADSRTPEEISLIQILPKQLTFSEEQLSVGKQMRKISDEVIRKSKFPAYGTIKIPVLLGEFQDVTFSYTKEDIDLLMNQPNYSEFGATGSVSDYFFDNSFGKMKMEADVYGPYKVSKDLAYYGKDVGAETVPKLTEFIKEVIEASSDDVDYSQYDNDKNGEVEAFYVIYAGTDQSQTGNIDEFWARKWNLPTRIMKNGVNLYNYSCSSELYYGKGGVTRLTGMGPIAHEFSHALGLVDYYDTDKDGSGGTARDLRNWDIMASGSHLNEDRTPPYHNAFSMEELGWLTIKEINSPIDKIELPKFVFGDSNTRIAYKINTFRGGLDDSEYFFFENKQRVKWDQYLPNTGLLVFHIDRVIMNETYNCWNCNPKRQAIYIVPADNRYLYERGPNVVFPYMNTNALTNDKNQPNMISNDGYPSYFILKNITHDTATGMVTFSVEKDDILLVDVCGEQSVSSIEQSFDAIPEGEEIEDYEGWRSVDIENVNLQWIGGNKFPEITNTQLSANSSFDTWLLSPMIRNNDNADQIISLKHNFIGTNLPKTIDVNVLQCRDNRTYMQTIYFPNYPKVILWGTSSKTITDIKGDYVIAFRFKGEKTADMTLRIDSVYLYQVGATGVHPSEKRISNMLLMPNPVSNTLTLESEVPMNEVKIYDLSGRLLLREKVAADFYLMDVKKLTPGLYTMTCTLKDGHEETHKFIKQ